MFCSELGQLGIGSLIFYASSILIVLSIPITVVLLKSNQEQITTASFSPVSFSSPPTISLELPMAQVNRGETVQLRVVATNSNWTIIYFSPQYPTIAHPYFKNGMTVVAQGATIGDTYYTAQEPGYFMAATFQLQGAYGEFKSGDLMCSWTGEVYLYRKETVNPIIEMIDSQARYRGTWDKLTTCQNVSLKRIEVR